MRYRVWAGVFAPAFVLAFAAALGGCSSAVPAPSSQTPVVVAESVSGAGHSGWTTPPTGAGYAAPGRAPVATRPAVEDGSRMPPPPPPPRVDGVQAPTWSTPAAGPPPAPWCPPAAAPAAPPPASYAVVPPREYTGCGLPCEQGISQWHVRAVGGLVFYEGKDPAEDCSYWGVDLGRTHCGCWGYDLYYRNNTGVFRRDAPPLRKDGGTWHHLGGKLTMERGLGGTGSRLYGWGGLGAGAFWTEDYVEDDSGFEAFGEVGVGYVLSRNFRVRAGVNVHGMDTEVTRRNPADDGESRWLWQIAPVLQLEGDF